VNKCLTRDKIDSLCYFIYGVRNDGANPLMRGYCSGLRGNCTCLIGDCTCLIGDCSGLRGDCTGLIGDCSGLIGDCTGLRGYCSGLRGNLDRANLTPEDRNGGVVIADLVGAMPELKP